ncbi:hypothetical protein KRR38_05640 [Novosphingobium sp. G106]|uniref:DUF7065 domain-containing protein n=1 Tax=Novosphingobium sp. G106 TaxID=2849500 RepID=UPI001C2DB98C|nr:hypothetical protein [Novosphingobium sp. G106]MBV1687169.1 hypothetical protein [Novosphingobium sp. G106]
MTLPNIDQFGEKRTDSPYWNESCWFAFSVPERKIHGFFYYFFRPNMNLLVGGPAMWDDSGANSYDCLFYDWQHIQAMPEGAEKFNFRAENGMAVELLEPWKQYRLLYDRHDFKLDLVWTAISEPHDFGGLEETTSGATGHRMHLEQCGRVTGTIRYKGEEFAVDSYSLRDTSFGERHFGQVMRGSYFSGIASPDLAFHTLTIGGDGEQKVAGGFLIKDGVMASLVGGSRRVTEEGKYTPAAFAFDMEDKLGRTLSLTARSSSHLIFPGYPDVPTVWSYLDWETEGQTGLLGDLQEFYPAADFRLRLRGQ